MLRAIPGEFKCKTGEESGVVPTVIHESKQEIADALAYEDRRDRNRLAMASKIKQAMMPCEMTQ
jgi:hypothetical protein